MAHGTATPIGQQYIGWKYSTPLESDYLNTFAAGLTTPGLLTRPYFKPKSSVSETGATYVIHPFSILVEPLDKALDNLKDENQQRIIQRLVKITFTQNIEINIPREAVAIGIDYDFTNNGIPQPQWYADVKVLTAANFSDPSSEDYFKGLIIGTVQYFKDDEGRLSMSVTSSGADISDALLVEEGWNPKCWLSLISPRRAFENQVIRLNHLEVRNHNNSYVEGDAVHRLYMSGQGGVKRFNKNNLNYNFRKLAGVDVDGIRGLMPKKYNCFSLHAGATSDKVGLYPKTWNGEENAPDCSNEEDGITKQSGGIFALVQCDWDVNNVPIGAFTNQLKIFPVKQESYNVYFDDNVLYIK